MLRSEIIPNNSKNLLAQLSLFTNIDDFSIAKAKADKRRFPCYARVYAHQIKSKVQPNKLSATTHNGHLRFHKGITTKEF